METERILISLILQGAWPTSVVQPVRKCWLYSWFTVKHLGYTARLKKKEQLCCPQTGHLSSFLVISVLLCCGFHWLQPSSTSSVSGLRESNLLSKKGHFLCLLSSLRGTFRSLSSIACLFMALGHQSSLQTTLSDQSLQQSSQEHWTALLWTLLQPSAGLSAHTKSS